MNTDAGYTTIDYAFYQSAGSLSVFENGTQRANLGSFVPGELLHIERNGTTITYRRNGNLVYTSPTASSTLLMADASIYSAGGRLAGIRTSFSTTSHTILRRFVYDNAGRLTKTYHTVDSNPEILIAQNDYNELGQLVDRKLHSANNGSTFKQSLDYRYNIRGWLKSMNNSQLTNDGGATNDDGNDLFGMELGYDNSIGTSNAAMYNGNISGMKWSTNLALGTIKNVGYNYSYDPMNRITAAGYLKNTAGTWANASNAFSESGYSYDLNGNISALTRKDISGASMDILSYDYGTTVSNQLLKVSDSGDKTKGFIEPSSTTGNDYSYDANGNMITDQNKGITAITYNFLNLPATVTKGSNSINYVYDAGGRKLSQAVNYTAFQKISDYVGEYFYENDTLRFINTEEGRVVMTSPVAQDALIAQYNLNNNANDQSGNGLTGTIYGGATAVADRNGTSSSAIQMDGTDDYVGVPHNAAFNVGATNFTVSFWVKKLVATSSWDNGFGVGKWNAVSSPGTNSWSLGLSSNGTDNVPSFAIEVGTNTFRASGTTEMQLNQWYFLQGVRKGNTLQVFVNGVLEGTATITQATWAVNNTTSLPVYVGRIGSAGYYTNAVFDEVQILHETTPGNLYEYQYHLKDHLGNVRLTFTTKRDVISTRATVETDSLSQERAKFLDIDKARRVNARIFDHTYNGTTPANGAYATRLTGSANEKIGLARSLSVMPGDTITVEVYAKYVDPNATNDNALTSVLAAIAANSGVPAGTVIDGSGYSSAGSAAYPFTGFFTPGNNGTAPKAYLNYLVFDRDFNMKDYGFRQVSTSARETGDLTNHTGLAYEGGSHEKLAFENTGSIKIKEAGYVYIWLSNEESTPVEVFFDDFKVTHVKSPVVQSDDYYPFGLAFNEYQRENTTPNKYKFNGIEEQNDLGLNIDLAVFRAMDPATGRWWQIDPKVEQYYAWTPYNMMGNNPVNIMDPLGDEWLTEKDQKIANKVNSQLGKRNDALAKNNSKLDARIAKAERKGNVDKVNSLKEKRCFNNQMIESNKKSISQLAYMGTKGSADDRVPKFTFEVSKTDKGLTSADQSTGIVTIRTIGSSFGNRVHEIQHGFDLSPKGDHSGVAGEGYETRAYQAQYAADPNSMPESRAPGRLENINSVNGVYIGGIQDTITLPNGTTQIKNTYEPIYQKYKNSYPQ